MKRETAAFAGYLQVAAVLLLIRTRWPGTCIETCASLRTAEPRPKRCCTTETSGNAQDGEPSRFETQQFTLFLKASTGGY